jgi:hypothetical protein
MIGLMDWFDRKAQADIKHSSSLEDGLEGEDKMIADLNRFKRTKHA